jgi:hypothetical protein
MIACTSLRRSIEYLQGALTLGGADNLYLCRFIHFKVCKDCCSKMWSRFASLYIRFKSSYLSALCI